MTSGSCACVGCFLDRVVVLLALGVLSMPFSSWGRLLEGCIRLEVQTWFKGDGLG